MLGFLNDCPKGFEIVNKVGMTAVNSVCILNDGFTCSDHGGHGHADDGSDNVGSFQFGAGKFVAAGCNNTVWVAHENIGTEFGKFRCPKKTCFVHPVVKQDLSRWGRECQGDKEGKHVDRKGGPGLGADDQGGCGFGNGWSLAGCDGGRIGVIGNFDPKFGKFPIYTNGMAG